MKSDFMAVSRGHAPVGGRPVRTANPDTAKPFSIRLTQAEKAALEARASGVPLSVFIRNTLLAEAAGRRARQSPLKDGDSLGRLLGLLGQSEIGPSLRQLAAQANAGTLYFDEHTRARVCAACDDVRAMRVLLLEALGKEILSGVQSPRRDLTTTFQAKAASTGAAS
jgi:hypothetical protein